ncbi:MAG: NlpC/P60 family protein, partial [Dietzia sp.]
MTHRVRSVAITAAAVVALSSGAVSVSAQTADPAQTVGPAQSTVPTGVDSPDAPPGEDLAELARLSGEAGALGEELHLARAELERANSERERREREAGVAAGLAVVADVGASRDQSLVDRLATMRYRGGDTGATRAAVLAESPRDLVDRLGTLQRLSGTTTSALDASRAASAEAARLRGEADVASEVARAAARDAQNRADELDRRSD